MNREGIARIAVHLLLAVFTANAANKFFVADLEYEATFHDYQHIFEFRGYAPDQYRILPLLGLGFVCRFLEFHHAVLVFNAIFAFLALELLWKLMRRWNVRQRYGFGFLFSILFIYTQYTGWRPDTLALLALCLFVVWISAEWRHKPWVNYFLLAGLVAISFSRSDIALAYAVFFSVYHLESWPLRVFSMLIPVGAQAALQLWIFPGAEYYTHTFMLMDNLRGFYLVQNPGTWLIAAAVVAWRKEIAAWLRADLSKKMYLYFVFTGYLLLVLVVGRINELRLYLPFIPLFLLLQHGFYGEEKTGHIRLRRHAHKP